MRTVFMLGAIVTFMTVGCSAPNADAPKKENGVAKGPTDVVQKSDDGAKKEAAPTPLEQLDAEITGLVNELNTGRDVISRRDAALALAKKGVTAINAVSKLERVIDALKEAEKQESPEVKKAASESLQGIEVPGWMNLLAQSEKDEWRERAAAKLGELGLTASAASPALKKAAQTDKNEKVREKAFKAFTIIRTAESQQFARKIKQYEFSARKVRGGSTVKQIAQSQDRLAMEVTVTGSDLSDAEFKQITSALPEEAEEVRLILSALVPMTVSRGIKGLAHLKKLQVLRFELFDADSPPIAQEVAKILHELPALATLQIDEQKYSREKHRLIELKGDK